MFDYKDVEYTEAYHRIKFSQLLEHLLEVGSSVNITCMIQTLLDETNQEAFEPI